MCVPFRSDKILQLLRCLIWKKETMITNSHLICWLGRWTTRFYFYVNYRAMLLFVPIYVSIKEYCDFILITHILLTLKLVTRCTEFYFEQCSWQDSWIAMAFTHKSSNLLRYWLLEWFHKWQIVIVTELFCSIW